MIKIIKLLLYHLYFVISFRLRKNFPAVYENSQWNVRNRAVLLQGRLCMSRGRCGGGSTCSHLDLQIVLNTKNYVINLRIYKSRIWRKNVEYEEIWNVKDWMFLVPKLSCFFDATHFPLIEENDRIRHPECSWVQQATLISVANYL